MRVHLVWCQVEFLGSNIRLAVRMYAAGWWLQGGTSIRVAELRWGKEASGSEKCEHCSLHPSRHHHHHHHHHHFLAISWVVGPHRPWQDCQAAQKVMPEPEIGSKKMRPFGWRVHTINLRQMHEI